MRNIFTLFTITCALSLPCWGVTVAVIDSGTDLKHPSFEGQVWENLKEISGNQLDDDGNGYKDDQHGWNFAENNSQLIDYSYLGTFSERPKKFFLIQGKMMKGEASPEEIAWMERDSSRTRKRYQS